MPNIDRSYYKPLLALLPANMQATAERFIRAIQEQKTVELASYVTIEQLEEADHGDLKGLSDDDHTQYYNEERGDGRYSRRSHEHTAESGRSVVSTAIDYTVTASDSIILASGTTTITLPLGISGTVYDIKNVGEETITVIGNEDIDDGETAVLSVQYDSVTVVSDGSAWYVI